MDDRAQINIKELIGYYYLTLVILAFVVLCSTTILTPSSEYWEHTEKITWRGLQNGGAI